MVPFKRSFWGVTLALAVAVGFQPKAVAAHELPQWLVEGERLTYDVSFWGFSAGQAEILLRPLTDQRYRVVARAWSNGLSSFVFIRDRVLVEGQQQYQTLPFAPDHYTVHLNENDYKARKSVAYQRQSQQLVYDNTRDDKPAKSFPLEPAQMRDVFSALYSLRQSVSTPQVGDVYTLPVWDLDKGYTLELKVLERVEKQTPWGKKPALHLQPVLQPLDGSKRAKDKWHFYVTDDGLFVPVEIAVELPVGSFKATLSAHGTAGSVSAAPAGLPETGAFEVNAKQRHTHANPVSD